MGASFAKNASKKTKGNKKKSSHSSVPPPIALDITETAMYESLDNNGHPSDYTYPQPSPTINPYSNTSAYSYITTNREGTQGNGGMDGMYHVLGADLTRTPQYDTREGPPPLPSRKDEGQEASPFYHLLEEETVYEDPEVQVRLRVRAQ